MSGRSECCFWGRVPEISLDWRPGRQGRMLCCCGPWLDVCWSVIFLVALVPHPSHQAFSSSIFYLCDLDKRKRGIKSRPHLAIPFMLKEILHIRVTVSKAHTSTLAVKQKYPQNVAVHSASSCITSQPFNTASISFSHSSFAIALPPAFGLWQDHRRQPLPSCPKPRICSS